MSKCLPDRLRPYLAKTLQKLRLNRVAHKIYYNYFHGFHTANKAVLDAQIRCFNYLDELGVLAPGDYMEFGIFKGYAFWHAQKIALEKCFRQMRFFGFDSFSGLPAVTGPDKSHDDIFYQGQYSCSRETVEQNLNDAGVNWSNTFLIEGFFDQTLNNQTRITYNLDQIAVALIDCDLYASTKTVLEFVADMVQDHSIFMFDDWNCFDKNDSLGQRRAFREFLEINTAISAQDFFEYGAYGKVFILRVNNPDIQL